MNSSITSAVAYIIITTAVILAIDRLSDNLSNDLSSSIDENYCNLAMDHLGENPVFLIDYSDIIKPLREKFEEKNKYEIIISRERKRMFCKCNKSLNYSPKEMDKFTISLWLGRNTHDVSK